MAKSAGRPSWFKMFLHSKAMLDAMPDEAVGKALKAIFHYFETKETIELDPMAFVAFSSIKPYVDESFDDFERDVKNGKKGGRPPKGEKPPVTPPNPGLPNQTEAEAEADTEADTDTEEDAKGSDKPTPPAKSSKTVKHKHGEYSNVLLTNEELDKLKHEFSDWKDKIDNLSGYIESTGKPYKSHYATIRRWASKDKEEAKKPRPGVIVNPCSLITQEDYDNDIEYPFDLE